jgi:demethylmenaquinone methyltransferase/2-methoxy-6-polyprenyl-1,4-benzoquinol methylase
VAAGPEKGRAGGEETAWFGFSRVPAGDKSLLVRRHFESIARRYDLMNTILSLGLHHLWKREAVRTAGLREGARIIDVCGGTGDLSILAAKGVGPRGEVILLDINRSMLEMARPKIERANLGGSLFSVQGDAEDLPLADDSFDAALVGFGIRNVTHVERGFEEMRRVLRPGGRLVCLEFSLPVNPAFGALYDFYSFAVMPLAGLVLAGSTRAYSHLAESIRTWHSPENLAAIIGRSGFRDVTWRRLTNGIAVIHTGLKA